MHNPTNKTRTGQHGSPIVVRFQLYATLSAGSSAEALLLTYGGSSPSFQTFGELITVHSAIGGFEGEVGDRGYALYWPDANRFETLPVSEGTILTPFQLNSGSGGDLVQGGSATATVIEWDAIGGVWTVTGATITVWDVPKYGPAQNPARGWAIYNDVNSRHEIISLPPGGREIYRFRLTEDLEFSSHAEAVLLTWNGADYDEGATIEVSDPYESGRWKAKSGAEGICAKLPDTVDYDILWLEHQPIFAHFVLTGDMDPDTGIADANPYDYWQGPDGNDQYARTQVFDPLRIYGHLFTGDEVMCCWDDTLEQYKICDGRSEDNFIRWFAATADWVNAPGNGSKVVCDFALGKDGPSTGMGAFDVYLPRASTSQDPNVREGDIIGAIHSDDGFLVCCTGYLDDCIGTIKIWSGAVADIRPGWQLCDGTNGTPDLREKFVLGASGDAGGDSDYDGEGGNTFVGEEGGLKEKMVNWEHTSFGSPVLKTFSTLQYIFQSQSFKTEKEDPPLTVTGTGTASISGDTDYALADLRITTEQPTPDHIDHVHMIDTASVDVADPGNDAPVDIAIPSGEAPCNAGPDIDTGPQVARGTVDVEGITPCTYFTMSHYLAEPGQTIVENGFTHPVDPPGDNAGHFHSFSNATIDAEDFNFKLHWDEIPPDEYNGHYHWVQVGTLDGKLTISDVTHGAPAGVPYNVHYHDYFLDNHQETINRIPPYYALAYIMRVD